MRDMIRMVVVLTVLASFSGGLLAALRDSTQDKIELQQLNFVKGPAIREILQGAANDPITDRFKVKAGETDKAFFVGVFDGKANTVALESFGKGFGGDIGVMVGVNVETDKIVGVGVTTHSETPGVGSRAKTEPAFSNQFKGVELKDGFKVKPDGGQVDAITGATVTTRGVAAALTDAAKTYQELKPKITQEIKKFQK